VGTPGQINGGRVPHPAEGDAEAGKAGGATAVTNALRRQPDGREDVRVELGGGHNRGARFSTEDEVHFTSSTLNAYSLKP